VGGAVAGLSILTRTEFLAVILGGLFLAYVATVTQLSRTVEALRHSGLFAEPESWESMVRTWNVDGLSVRPDHRMVAHTGFLLTARRPAAGPPPRVWAWRTPASKPTTAAQSSWMSTCAAPCRTFSRSVT